MEEWRASAVLNSALIAVSFNTLYSFSNPPRAHPAPSEPTPPDHAVRQRNHLPDLTPQTAREPPPRRSLCQKAYAKGLRQMAYAKASFTWQSFRKQNCAHQSSTFRNSCASARI